MKITDTERIFIVNQIESLTRCLENINRCTKEENYTSVENLIKVKILKLLEVL